MQIIYLPDHLMIISYIILWPTIQLTVAIICNGISDKHFTPNSFWLKPKKWEKDGEIYETIFKVHSWKKYLQDGDRVHKNGFHKRHITSSDPEYLEAFIAETGRAEIIHWLEISPFWIFGLWSPPIVILIMLAYALIINMPCIIAQRYNRPRLIKHYKHSVEKQARKNNS